MSVFSLLPSSPQLAGFIGLGAGGATWGGIWHTQHLIAGQGVLKVGQANEADCPHSLLSDASCMMVTLAVLIPRLCWHDFAQEEPGAYAHLCIKGVSNDLHIVP